MEFSGLQGTIDGTGSAGEATFTPKNPNDVIITSDTSYTYAGTSLNCVGSPDGGIGKYLGEGDPTNVLSFSYIVVAFH